MKKKGMPVPPLPPPAPPPPLQMRGHGPGSLMSPQMQSLQTSLQQLGSLHINGKLMPSLTKQHRRSNSGDMSKLHDLAKDDLLKSLQEMGALVYESFYRELVSGHEWKKSVEPFIKECVRICWLMVDRDHPIYIKTSEKRGSEFDTYLYKYYTRSGQMVDYIVWPALFLHENGPLLCKGIAQPMARKK